MLQIYIPRFHNLSRLKGFFQSTRHKDCVVHKHFALLTVFRQVSGCKLAHSHPRTSFELRSTRGYSENHWNSWFRLEIREICLRKNHDLDTFPDSEDQIKKIDPKEVSQDRKSGRNLLLVQYPRRSLILKSASVSWKSVKSRGARITIWALSRTRRTCRRPMAL